MNVEAENKQNTNSTIFLFFGKRTEITFTSSYIHGAYSFSLLKPTSHAQQTLKKRLIETLLS
jgi:hypothetical protein